MRTSILVLSLVLPAAALSAAPTPVRIRPVVGILNNAPGAITLPGVVRGGVKIQLPAPKLPAGPLVLIVKAVAPAATPAVEQVPSLEKLRGMFDGSKVAPAAAVVEVPAGTITLPEADLEKEIGL